MISLARYDLQVESLQPFLPVGFCWSSYWELTWLRWVVKGSLLIGYQVSGPYVMVRYYGFKTKRLVIGLPEQLVRALASTSTLI